MKDRIRKTYISIITHPNILWIKRKYGLTFGGKHGIVQCQDIWIDRM